MGNPATLSKFSLAKDKVTLALLPIGPDGRGNVFTREIFQDFVGRWAQSGSQPVPVVLTHDQDRDRPAVGWIQNFKVSSTHLSGDVALLPKGTKALYGTHAGWSCEVDIDQQSRITVTKLALLGATRPHFKDLNNHSQYYETKMETPQEPVNQELLEDTSSQVSDVEELLEYNDQLYALVTSKDELIAELTSKIEMLMSEKDQYQEAELDREVDEIYSEIIAYGCACDKEAVSNTYKGMAADLRPEYRKTVTAIASRGEAAANKVTSGAKLLYGAEGAVKKASERTSAALRRMGV